MTYTPGRVVGSPEQDIYQGPDDPGTALPYGTPYTWHEVDALGQHVDTHYKVAGRPDLAANLDTAVTAVDANAASALRVQQDARLSSTFATVVDAGTDLDTARPAGATLVIWRFDSGTVTGDAGENVTNGQDGDLFVVLPA